MIKNHFRVVAKYPVPDGNMRVLRYRLGKAFGQSYWVRVGEPWALAREVWETPEGLQYSIIANRRGTKLLFSLIEVTYDEHEIVQRTRARLKHKTVTRIAMPGEDPL